MTKLHEHNQSNLAHVMMHGRRAAGGPAPTNNMPINPTQYKRGGHPSHHKMRHHHAEGGQEGINPVTGSKVPSLETKMLGRYKGGPTCHAEGDSVPTEQKRMEQKHGGSSKRKRHADGDEIRPMHVMSRLGQNGAGIFRGYDKGGETDNDHDADDKMRRGGHKKKIVSKHTKHHNRDYREHHDFGDTVGNIFSGLASAAPYLLPLLLAEGDSVPTEQKRMEQKHGGSSKRKRHTR